MSRPRIALLAAAVVLGLLLAVWVVTGPLLSPRPLILGPLVIAARWQRRRKRAQA